MCEITSPTQILTVLIVGAVLLLYGVRQMADAVPRITNARVQRVLTGLLQRPLAAFVLGILTTALMQSSSVVSSLLVGMVSAGLVSLAAAIVMLLGANVGSALVVQLLALHITDYALELVGLGALLALLTRGGRWRRLGQVCFAFGLIVLGLAALALGSQPIAASPLTASVLRALVNAPLVLLLIGTLLAVLFSSSTASIGLILTLTASGALPVAAALALTLGANIGTTLLAFFSAIQEGTLIGRRLALVHAGTKLVGALTVLAFLGPLAGLLADIWPNADTQVAMLHLGFNLSLAILFVPLAAPLARLMGHVLPDTAPARSAQTGPRYLDPSALTQPAVALGQATRETLYMAEIVSEMLKHSLEAFEDNVVDPQINAQENDELLDTLNAAIKSYLARLNAASMTEAQVRQEVALLYITTDLQAIGEEISKRLQDLARRKQSGNLFFAEEGYRDLLIYHQELWKSFQQILAALAAHDTLVIEMLLVGKKARSQMKREIHLRHLERLRAGDAPSLASSSLYLDLLDALSDMLSHITSIAYVLRDSRTTTQNQNTAPAFSAQAQTMALTLSDYIPGQKMLNTYWHLGVATPSTYPEV